MSRFYFLSLLLLLTACQSATQMAEQPSAHQIHHGVSPGHRLAFIEEFDTDGDAEVSRAEFAAARTAKLKSMDANADGRVDKNEYIGSFISHLKLRIKDERDSHLKQTQVRFQSLDTDKNNQVTWEEYWASGEKSFRHFAGDEDKLSLQTPEPPARPGPIRPPSVLGMPSSHTLAGFIAINDSDGDQQLTLAEFQQVRRAIFDNTDRNGNGWLDEEEYLAEFLGRLDRQAEAVLARQAHQAHVRFDALDTDADKSISLEEFSISGARIFDGWDLDGDGRVSEADPLPKNPDEKSTPVAKTADPSY